MILERFKTFELKEYQEVLYHILDLEKLLYVLKNDEIKSYKFYNISLTRDVTMNYYIGDSPLSIVKLELDARKLRSKYKIKPFSYKSARGQHFDESEEQVQTQTIKPALPYIKKVILIKKRIESLLKPFHDTTSNYATSIGTRNGNIRDIISKIKEAVEKSGLELYVQKGTKIEKDDDYIESLLNYPIKYVEEKYAIVHRGHIKKDIGYLDVFVDEKGRIIQKHFVGMTFPKDVKTYDLKDLPTLDTFKKDGEKFVPYVLTLNKKDDGSWKLVDMEPQRSYAVTESVDISTQLIFDSIPWQDNSRDLYPGYSKEEQDFTEEYYFETREKALDYAEHIKDLFDSLPSVVKIYRSLKAKSQEDIDLEYPGESWSFDRESAINFGLRNGSNFLLSAKIKKEDINWQGTIKAYVLFSGTHSEDDENEIVVDDPEKLMEINVEKMKKM